MSAAKGAFGIGVNAAWNVGGRALMYGGLSALVSAAMIYTLHAQLVHYFRMNPLSWILYMICLAPFVVLPYFYGVLGVRTGVFKSVESVLLDNARLEMFARQLVQSAIAAVQHSALGIKALKHAETVRPLIAAAASTLTTAHSGYFVRMVQRALSSRLSGFLTKSVARADLSNAETATETLVTQLKSEVRGYLTPSRFPLRALIGGHLTLYLVILIFLR